MIDPKEITIKTQKGEDKVFVISKMPYASAGREVCTQFISSAMPQLGHYPTNHDLMLKMMAYVGVKQENGNVQMLTTPALVDNHITDVQTGIRLEKEMLEYNFGFFDLEKTSAFLQGLSQKFLTFLTPMLTQLSQQLSKKDAPPSTN